MRRLNPEAPTPTPHRRAPAAEDADASSRAGRGTSIRIGFAGKLALILAPACAVLLAASILLIVGAGSGEAERIAGIGIAGAGLLALGLGALAARSALGEVRASRRVLEEIAETGRLQLRCPTRVRGEVGALNRATNDVLENFESIVRDVSSKSTVLTDALAALDRRHDELVVAARNGGTETTHAPWYPAVEAHGLGETAFGLFALSCAFEVGEEAPLHQRRFPRTSEPHRPY